ncbi:aldehyde dehydrogenase family protein [Jannaschia formosa]|uniref:aldehyde dehydrogenase family protein n=1 Tax=Jannaschia formosa TaxID=2259592 RepID=UPI000E1C3079|nr:aldehyde dehydrogenase family protein [Jannaschia formosa]TFL16296.1 aldehyde dehydrogenase family protein [Jannaschia formosa]
MEGSDPVRAAFDRLHGAFDLGTVPPVAARRARLGELAQALRDDRERITAAVSEDFGPRARVETLTSELAFTLEAIRDLRARLPRWARPRRARVLRPVPGRTEIWREPKGVVGILSPWNYPLQLALVPTASAVAAGNKVLLKPSERSPATAAYLADLIARVFPPDEAAVVTGDAGIAAQVTELPLGHLFFTGSTETGRKVALAAARNLVPVTLELGGKSPAIVLPGAQPADHADAIAWGKWFSAGQTCVAPDHLLVPRGTAAAWADALLEAAGGFLQRPGDYTAMIDARARDRALAMIEEARAAGAELRALEAGAPHVPPTIVLNPPEDGTLMREEIFGPALPILEYDDTDQVIARQRGRTPLAAYAFGPDRDAARDLLARIRSGGAATNAAILHLAVHDLPFGGIGASGMGAYHGDRGLDAFTHERGVFHAARGPWLRLLSPPHSPIVTRFIERMAR